MAAHDEGSCMSGSSFVFAELAIDVSTRDPKRKKTLALSLSRTDPPMLR